MQSVTFSTPRARPIQFDDDHPRDAIGDFTMDDFDSLSSPRSISTDQNKQRDEHHHQQHLGPTDTTFSEMSSSHHSYKTMTPQNRQSHHQHSVGDSGSSTRSGRRPSYASSPPTSPEGTPLSKVRQLIGTGVIRSTESPLRQEVLVSTSDYDADYDDGMVIENSYPDEQDEETYHSSHTILHNEDHQDITMSDDHASNNGHYEEEDDDLEELSQSSEDDYPFSPCTYFLSQFEDIIPHWRSFIDPATMDREMGRFLYDTVREAFEASSMMPFASSINFEAIYIIMTMYLMEYPDETVQSLVQDEMSPTTAFYLSLIGHDWAEHTDTSLWTHSIEEIDKMALIAYRRYGPDPSSMAEACRAIEDPFAAGEGVYQPIGLPDEANLAVSGGKPTFLLFMQIMRALWQHDLALSKTYFGIAVASFQSPKTEIKAPYFWQGVLDQLVLVLSTPRGMASLTESGSDISPSDFLSSLNPLLFTPALADEPHDHYHHHHGGGGGGGSMSSFEQERIDDDIDIMQHPLMQMLIRAGVNKKVDPTVQLFGNSISEHAMASQRRKAYYARSLDAFHAAAAEAEETAGHDQGDVHRQSPRWRPTAGDYMRIVPFLRPEARRRAFLSLSSILPEDGKKELDQHQKEAKREAMLTADDVHFIASLPRLYLFDQMCETKFTPEQDEMQCLDDHLPTLFTVLRQQKINIMPYFIKALLFAAVEAEDYYVLASAISLAGIPYLKHQMAALKRYTAPTPSSSFASSEVDHIWQRDIDALSTSTFAEQLLFGSLDVVGSWVAKQQHEFYLSSFPASTTSAVARNQKKEEEEEEEEEEEVMDGSILHVMARQGHLRQVAAIHHFQAGYHLPFVSPRWPLFDQSQGRSALSYLLEQGNDALAGMMYNGYDNSLREQILEERDHLGRSPLHYAAIAPSAEGVNLWLAILESAPGRSFGQVKQMFLQRVVDHDGRSPFMLAIEKGRASTVNAFIKKNVWDDDHIFPDYFIASLQRLIKATENALTAAAAAAAHTETLSLSNGDALPVAKAKTELLEATAIFEIFCARHGSKAGMPTMTFLPQLSAAHLAARAGFVHIVDLMIQAGVNFHYLSSSDKTLDTPLMDAVERGHTAVVHSILRQKVSQATDHDDEKNDWLLSEGTGKGTCVDRYTQIGFGDEPNWRGGASLPDNQDMARDEIRMLCYRLHHVTSRLNDDTVLTRAIRSNQFKLAHIIFQLDPKRLLISNRRVYSQQQQQSQTSSSSATLPSTLR